MENQPIDSGMPGTQTARMPESALFLIKAIAGWTKLLGVIGAIMIVLMIIFAFGMATFMSGIMAQTEAAGALPGAFLTVIYLIIAAIYALPVYFLLMFSKHAKRYHAGNAIEDGINALKHIKNFFLFFGILALIGVTINVIVFLGMIVGGLFVM